MGIRRFPAPDPKLKLKPHVQTDHGYGSFTVNINQTWAEFWSAAAVTEDRIIFQLHPFVYFSSNGSVYSTTGLEVGFGAAGSEVVVERVDNIPVSVYSAGVSINRQIYVPQGTRVAVRSTTTDSGQSGPAMLGWMKA